MQKIFLCICMLTFSLGISLTTSAEPNSTCPILTRQLSLGSRGEEVSILQFFLKEKGFFTYQVTTGYFGKLTQKAVIEFQQANNIDPIGIIGPKTRAKIVATCATQNTSLMPNNNQSELSKTITSPLVRILRSGRSIQSDITPPNISITSPTNNTYTSGSSINIHADASDNKSVTSVQFQIDNSNLGAPVTTAPYEITWDFSTAVAGSHTISAIARDAAGNSKTSNLVNVITLTHSVGGTVSGLTGSGLVLQNNNADDLSISANGSLTFATPITEGSSYSISISEQPEGQTCVVTNGTGTMGVSDITNISISCSSRLLSITVIPSNSSLPRNINKQFTAMGAYADSSTADITTSVTWDTSFHNIATITETGLITGVNAGTTQVSATLGSISGTTALTVTNATLVSISISPINPAVSRGSTLQLTATGTFSDSTLVDITSQASWTSTATNIATVNDTDHKGQVTGVSGGITSIHTDLDSILGTTTLFIGS